MNKKIKTLKVKLKDKQQKGMIKLQKNNRS